MEGELESPWSQLVSIVGEEEVVPIVGSKFLIGRKTGRRKLSLKVVEQTVLNYC